MEPGRHIQFGFHSSRPTGPVTPVYDFVSKHVDEGGMTDVILLDVSKVFNAVVHSLLILYSEQYVLKIVLNSLGKF